MSAIICGRISPSPAGMSIARQGAMYTPSAVSLPRYEPMRISPYGYVTLDLPHKVAISSPIAPATDAHPHLTLSGSDRLFAPG